MIDSFVTLAGIVGTDPRAVVTQEGLPITSFRLGATRRRYDRTTSSWVDGDTTWVTVTCFRGLASNVAKSVLKRDRVIVSGRLRVKEWQDGSGRIGVEIEAEAVGHDLTFGTTVLTRTTRQTHGETVAGDDGGEAEVIALVDASAQAEEQEQPLAAAATG